MFINRRSHPFLQQHFGKANPCPVDPYYSLARSRHRRTSRGPDRVRESIGAETTFDADHFSAEEARAALEPLIDTVWYYCEDSTIRGRTATLKAKFADFQQITRNRTLDHPVESRAVLGELGGLS